MRGEVGTCQLKRTVTNQRRRAAIGTRDPCSQCCEHHGTHCRIEVGGEEFSVRVHPQLDRRKQTIADVAHDHHVRTQAFVQTAN